MLIRTLDGRSEERLMGWQGLFEGTADMIRVNGHLWTEEGVAVYAPEVKRRLIPARALA